VTLKASDDVAVAGTGIEYRLGAGRVWLRYRTPIRVPRRTSLTWRAVDVDGNAEATHTLAPTR